MQREITIPCRVFEENGEVKQAGWAREPVFDYNREQSKTKGKHCEQDCYFINNSEVSLFLAVENYGSEFNVRIAVADLKRGGVMCDSVVKKFSFGKYELPEDRDKGELLFNDKRLQLQITHTVDGRFLKCDFIDFGGVKNLYFNLVLKKLDGDTLNELAPFERNRKYFYFKRFAPVYSASGTIRLGGLDYSLSEISSVGYLDWTRYSKPRKHNYQRLSCDCAADGSRFSLCLASRVGDNRFGNENCFFVNGRLEKLSNINVKGTPNRMDRPFFFKGGMSALDITFKPFTVRGEAMAANMNRTTVIFGRLFGAINRVGYDQPIVVDNMLAHLIFSEF